MTHDRTTGTGHGSGSRMNVRARITATANGVAQHQRKQGKAGGKGALLMS